MHAFKTRHLEHLINSIRFIYKAVRQTMHQGQALHSFILLSAMSQWNKELLTLNCGHVT